MFGKVSRVLNYDSNVSYLYIYTPGTIMDTDINHFTPNAQRVRGENDNRCRVARAEKTMKTREILSSFCNKKQQRTV